jgi:hypothetical protein
MDIVSPIAYFLDFLKNLCCDYIIGGAEFLERNNDEVAILKNPNSCPLPKLATSILDHVTFWNMMKLLLPPLP